MADEEVVEGQETEARNDINNRFTKLSQKIDEEAKARAKAEERLLKQEDEKNSIAKERDFYKNFNPLLKKYPDAADLQDQILERAQKGYDIEEATIAALAKVGKFNPKFSAEVQVGGSSTNLPSTGQAKTVGEMNQDERRLKLKELLG